MTTNPDNTINPPSNKQIGSEAPPVQPTQEEARKEAERLKKEQKDASRKRREEAKKLKEERKKERKKKGLGDRRDLDYATSEIVDMVKKLEKDNAGLDRKFRAVAADLAKAGKAVAEFRVRTFTDCGHLVAFDSALTDVVAAMDFIESKRNELFDQTKVMLPFETIIQLLKSGNWEQALKNPAVIFTKEAK